MSNINGNVFNSNKGSVTLPEGMVKFERHLDDTLSIEVHEHSGRTVTISVPKYEIVNLMSMMAKVAFHQRSGYGVGKRTVSALRGLALEEDLAKVTEEREKEMKERYRKNHEKAQDLYETMFRNQIRAGLFSEFTELGADQQELWINTAAEASKIVDTYKR